MRGELLAVGAAAAIIAASAASVATAGTTTRPAFGCFRVTASALNIRDRPFSTAAVIGMAEKGDILVKRRRWCTWRGFWCAVRYDGIDGYADKSFMEVAPCPASLSEPAD